MTENNRTYNGWSNYETWAVALWLDNERGSYEYWREQAAEHRRAASTRRQAIEGTWTAEEAAKFTLADQLKGEITDGSPLTEPTLYSDLLTLPSAKWTGRKSPRIGWPTFRRKKIRQATNPLRSSLNTAAPRQLKTGY